MEVTFLVALVMPIVIGAEPLPSIEIETGLGRIRGFQDDVYGKKVDVFLGIPFAKPPVGNRRFQRPEQVAPWHEPIDATRKPATCWQAVDSAFGRFEGVDMWNPNTNMSEDCLYLSIWAPSDRSVPPRAVMVWIYGGGFYGGTSTLDLYDGRMLATQQDVIVVSMQYRVGTIGFLYLGTGDAPGNMGLVDQHLALQWVYNHIGKFGGDNHRVTLFGESAGAVSVSLHLVSPLSRQLFQNAIMQSGSAVCRWAYESQADARKRSLTLAKKLNCAEEVTTDENVHDVIACLQKVDPGHISNEMWTVQDSYNMVTPILATLDEYFLRESPVETVRRGNLKKANILLGANKDEGAYFLIYGIPQLFFWNHSKILPEEQYLSIVQTLSHSNEVVLRDTIDFEYGVPQAFGSPVQRPRDLLDDILGDAEFLCPVVEFAERYAERGDTVYLYHFLHRTSANPWPQWMGVMHGYEIDHIFGLPLNRTFTYLKSEKAFARKMMAFWANFAKNGDPNDRDGDGPEWVPYTEERKEYLTLDDDALAIRSGLRTRKCHFWNDYFPRLLRTVQKANSRENGIVCKGCRLRVSSSSLVLSLVLLIGPGWYT